ncbi:hypothetical protein, partial [uncultured Phascolarctobacterium sp.]|uniref:hypothetical protein n=1 Tax=uncultured Phascolarctobacterium sp. TaxID=512296 RepID=UPI0025D2537D
NAIAIASTKDFFILFSSSSMRDFYLLQNLLAQAHVLQSAKVALFPPACSHYPCLRNFIIRGVEAACDILA